jgi:hypothetical protein
MFSATIVSSVACYTEDRIATSIHMISLFASDFINPWNAGPLSILFFSLLIFSSLFYRFLNYRHKKFSVTCKNMIDSISWTL